MVKKRRKWKPINPQYVKDEAGKTVAIYVTVKVYEGILKNLKELDEVKIAMKRQKQKPFTILPPI